MSTATFPLRRIGPASAPVLTGVALAATVGVFYSLCTVAWFLAPGPFLGFINSLFHGIDFSSLVRPAGFTWAGYLQAVSVMTVWTFLAGAFFGWLRELLGR